MPSYKMHQQVLSHHCDSAGIVHFPRYLEMANGLVERWFDDALDWSFARMQGGDNAMVAFGRCNVEFPAASRLGDHLVWRLDVLRIGRTSMDLQLNASCGGASRVAMVAAVVLSDVGVMRSRRWPDEIRARAEEYLAAPEPA